MSTAKTTMHPAASPERNYMLDASAAIRQQHQKQKLALILLTPIRSFDCNEPHL
jgi:hypothetical protein